MWITVLVGGLGYFVDIFDIILFGAVRTVSLRDLGIAEDQIFSVGAVLFSWQMTGMLIGGLLWGILGDKKGRISVLFGSIILYSLANLANGYVSNVNEYAVLRFIAGIGLAGELGAAITLVAESLPQKYRGYGTAIVAGIGLCGGVAGGYIAETIAWRSAYIVGGIMGLVLLALRFGVLESDLFTSLQSDSSVRRGDLRMLFSPFSRFRRYVLCILMGVPIWYVASILMMFAPEIGKQLQTTGPVTAGKAIMYSYIGVVVGDLLTGWLSHLLKSRKKVVIAGMILEAVLVLVLLTWRGMSPTAYYGLCIALGFSTGYWAVAVTLAAEQFGTNLRATAATSVPNFIRGSAVLMTLGYGKLCLQMDHVSGALVIGGGALLLGFFSIFQLEETYSKDLNYLEK